MSSHHEPPDHTPPPGSYDGYRTAGREHAPDDHASRNHAAHTPPPYGHATPPPGAPGGPPHPPPPFHDPHRVPPPPPHRSTGRVALSILWAFVPILTCGVGTPFTMGHAAARRRSPWLALAAVLYGIGIISFWAAVSIYESSDQIPGEVDAFIAVGFFGSTIGGVVHSFLIRSSVFPGTSLFASPPVPQQPYGRPGPHAAHPHAAASPSWREAETVLSGTDKPSGRPRAAAFSAPQEAQSVPPGPRRTPAGEPAAKPLRATDPAQIGPYRLLGLLGRGGQGAVYLGLTPDGARVAVKVLHDWFAGDETAKSRFLREVEATRRVAPFSTARVLDVRVDDELAYIVSEYVDGCSLEQLVREQGPRDADALTRLALATSGALAAIHRAGIVHRDFKPANVLIGSDGPRVIDFGIARALDQTSATSGKIIGTPAYMSPEQFSSGRVGPASDIFSWAATMIYAASGRAAFEADSIPAVINRILNHQPDLSCLPAAMRPLAAACLDKNPDNRPTASEVMLGIVH